MPAISKSCTTISASTRLAVPSGRLYIDGRHRGPAIAHAQAHCVLAANGRAGVETFRRRQTPNRTSRPAAHRRRLSTPDRVVRRCRSSFLSRRRAGRFPAAARSGRAREIVHHVARPAASIAGAGQALFGRKYAVAAARRDMTLEIGLGAEQPEPALNLPVDADGTVPRRARAKAGPGSARAVQYVRARGGRRHDKKERGPGREINSAHGGAGTQSDLSP